MDTEDKKPGEIYYEPPATVENRTYSAGWEPCVKCGVIQPLRRLLQDAQTKAYVCTDIPWCANAEAQRLMRPK